MHSTRRALYLCGLLALGCSERMLDTGDDVGEGDGSGEEDGAGSGDAFSCDDDPRCSAGLSQCFLPTDDVDPTSCAELCDLAYPGRYVCIDRGCDGKTVVGWPQSYRTSAAAATCSDGLQDSYQEILDYDCDEPIDFTEPNAGLVACCCGEWE